MCVILLFLSHCAGTKATFTPGGSTHTPDTKQSAKGNPSDPLDPRNLALHFFDAEFTNQQLSLSMLEDTLVSEDHTPVRTGRHSRNEGES